MLKVAVIGGGSTYTPELVTGFLARVDRLPIGELWLADIDTARLDVVGGFARRMVEAAGRPFSVQLTTDRQAAIRDADYVITQLRVGQMVARRADEYLAHRHGLIGQETTGIGGMACALRTIPIMLGIARDVHELAAPGALLVNFTNPSGLVTQALSQHSHAAVIGLCNEPLTTQRHFTELLSARLGAEIHPARTELRTLGLNHLTWHSGFTVDGVDHWRTVLDAVLDEARSTGRASWAIPTIETLGLVPNSYVGYFLDTATKLAEQQAWPPSRADIVADVESDLLARYADPALVEPPAELMKRGGAHYSTAASELVADHHEDRGTTHIINVANRGAVAEWPDDWVLEIPTTVTRRAITPLPTAALPPACSELVARVKAYELHTVHAAVHGDRDSAREALLAHPLGPCSDSVDAVLDDLLATNLAHLPQFDR